MVNVTNPLESAKNDTASSIFESGLAQHAPYSTFGRSAVQSFDNEVSRLLSSASHDQTLVDDPLIASDSRLEPEQDDSWRHLVGKLFSTDQPRHKLVVDQASQMPVDLGQSTNQTVEDQPDGVPLIEYEIYWLRRQFRELSQQASTVIDSYLNNSVPPVVRLAKNKSQTISMLPDEVVKSKQDSQKSWSLWLADDATDEELINVIQWHTHVLGEQAVDPELRDIINHEKKKFTIQATALFELGTLSRKPKSVENTDVVIGDMFDTVARGMGGYHFFGSDSVVMHQGQGKTIAQRRESVRIDAERVLMHEFVHRAIDSSDEYSLSPVHVRWIDEALTQILSIMIRQNSAPEVTDNTYEEEINLFNQLVNHGDDKSKLYRAAFRAFSGGTDEAKIFGRLLDKAWDANDTLQKINRNIAYNERAGLDKGYSERQARVYSLERVSGILAGAPDFILARDLKP